MQIGAPEAVAAAGSGRQGLRGRLVTRDGWAVPHAVATVTDATGRQVARAEADGGGAVATGPLAPGAYTVVVTAAGYLPAARTAIATGSGAAELGTLVLARQGGAELPPPGVWTVDPSHSAVAATAQHLGLSSVHGRFAEFASRIVIAPRTEDSSVVAEIKAASVDTGNPTRDDHLRSADFLDAEQHPVIAYRGSGLTPAGPDRWTVHGQLTLAGVTRQVDLALAYLGTGPDPWGGVRAAFRATAELRREDFAMNWNQIVQAGIAAIGATLRVELDIQAVQGEALPQG
ncbi:YceI family protein [Peterkaempfera sp. SMS 1(5)a]|uniref:YceI family protein n=1 Tax=Peterkaempfera podocarpi TaxID=3232308 RepID=UPI003671DEBA